MTAVPEWAEETLLGGRSKSEAMSPGGRRMVDVVCREPGCGERLAAVTVQPEGLRFDVWGPALMVRADNTGEPFYAVRVGRVPGDDEHVTVHCFKHGHGVVTGEQIRRQVSRYADKGNPQRLPIAVARQGAER